MVTICVGVCLGDLLHRYAAYKIALGPEPEEEDEEALKKAYAARRFSFRKYMGSSGTRAVLERFIFILLSAALWGLYLQIFKLNVVFLLYAFTATVLLAQSLVDWEIQELPPELNLLIGIAGLAHLMTDLSHWPEYLIGAVSVSGLFLLIGLIKYRGQEAMGGGDMKLMAALGLLLGWKNALLILLLGCLLGSVIHLLLMAVLKKGRVLAFGPYLSAGAIITMICGQRIIDWYISLLTASMR
ncbi:MAG: A24 family peptidase [Lachnospiraceae bacterium]|nr:A24 family peptidase [Lachnospiraceae bacterium]